MNKAKFIAFFTVFGFLFSLVIGLFSSGVTVGWAFLRALLFGILFLGIGFVLSILYENFFKTDSFDENINVQNSESGLGQHIDLVTPDEPLQMDAEASKFYVGNKHQMLNTEDYYGNPEDKNIESEEELDSKEELVPKEKTAHEIIAEQNAQAISQNSVQQDFSKSESKSKAGSDSQGGFIPVALHENAQNFSSVEASSKSEYLKEKSSNANNSEDSSELDALPDLDELQDISGVSAEENLSENSTFEPSGKSSSADDIVQGNDVSLIAKALSTVLKRSE